MSVYKYVGENVDFDFTVLDSLGAAADLQGATLQFCVRNFDSVENEIDRVPTAALNVVSDSLTGAETILLGAGVFRWEFKVAIGTEIKKKQGRLYLYATITD